MISMSIFTFLFLWWLFEDVFEWDWLVAIVIAATLASPTTSVVKHVVTHEPQQTIEVPSEMDQFDNPMKELYDQ